MQDGGITAAAAGECFIKSKDTDSSGTSSQGRRFRSSAVSSQDWGFALVRLAACWQTDGSSNRSHIIILQGPALSQEEFPGITVQMVVCNEPSGVSGFNVSPQHDSHYCVYHMFVRRAFRTRSRREMVGWGGAEGMRWWGGGGAEDAVCGIFMISCVSVCDWLHITVFVGYQRDSFSLCHCSVHWCCLLSSPTLVPFFYETVTVDLILMQSRLILCEGVKL